MFDIQVKSSGQFLDIADSEQLALTITSSLFETSTLAGSYGYEIKVLDSPANAILFDFSANVDSSTKVSKKVEVIVWLNGSSWNDAVLTVKRAANKSYYQTFLTLGISAYIDSVLNRKLTKLTFPNNNTYRLLRRLIGLPFVYDNRLKYIKIKFKTPTIDDFIQITCNLDGDMPNRATLIGQLNDGMVSVYGSNPAEFLFEADPDYGDVIRVYSGKMGISSFDIYFPTEVQEFRVENGTYSIWNDDETATIDRFSMSALTPFHVNFLSGSTIKNKYGDSVNASIRELVGTMCLAINDGDPDYPFVFAPIENPDFYTTETKPASYTSHVNATGRMPEIGLLLNDVDNPNKYIFSPQLRLRHLLMAIDSTFPNTFDFSSLLELGSSDQELFFRNIAIYNNFSALNYYFDLDRGFLLPGMDSYGPSNTNLDENSYFLRYQHQPVANLSEVVKYSDLVPYITVAELINTLKNLFCMNVSFNFFTRKIELKFWKDILSSTPIDISKYVSIATEKQETNYDSLSLLMVDDSTDKNLETKFDPSNYILLASFTKQEYDDYYTAHPLQSPSEPNYFLYSNFDWRLDSIYNYAVASGLIDEEPTQENWPQLFIVFIEHLGYYRYSPSIADYDLLHPDDHLWVWTFGAKETQFKYVSSGSKKLEIEINNSQFVTATNPLAGHVKIPSVKQLGKTRVIYPFKKMSYSDTSPAANAPMGLRLFLFDTSKIPGGSDLDVYPRAIPLQFTGNKFTEGEHSIIPNLPIYDFLYKYFDKFIANTEPIVISLKVDALFLQNFIPGSEYLIGSQKYIFKELRCSVPKNKRAKNKRYGAEADVYIIRNYSV